MAEERTLGVVRAREVEDDEDPSKADLQRRMEEARDSISNTVTEIRDTVSNTVTEIRDTVNEKYENVKDALDWREHYKRQPVAWTVGAAGVGFLVGYGLAAALTDDNESSNYVSAASESYERLMADGGNSARAFAASASPTAATNGNDQGPGLIERFKETSAYDRLSKEAGSLGDRFVEELSTTAQTVVLPLLLNKIRSWIGVDLSNKSEHSGGASMGSNEATAYRASGERTT